MNDASRRRLEKVHPTLSTRIQALLDTLAQHGLTVEVVQGLRTFAEQDALFAQGRIRPGPIVTRARGGQSNHNYGLACDLVPFNDGKPNWNAPLGVWTTIGTEAEKLGLEWGGDWRKFVDKPHVQLPGLSIAECFALFKRGGLNAVWAEATRRLSGVAQVAPSPQLAPAAPVQQASGATGTSSSHPLLRLKVRGDAVRALQQALAAAGLLPEAGIDGVFGQRTLAAVRKFQQSKNLEVDGIVGSATWEALLSTPAAMKGMHAMEKAIGKVMPERGGSRSKRRAGAKKSGAGKKRPAKKR